MVYLLPDEIKILSEIENCGWVSESKIENEDSLHILESMGMVESFTTGYSCAGVPLFRRNGYRQSSGRKPLFRNRDTALN